MAFGNLGVDKFCTFNQRFNIMHTIEQKLILLKISRIIFLSYRTTTLNNYVIMVKSTFEKLQNVKVCTGVLMCMISSLDLAAYLLARMFIVYKQIVLDTAL